MDKFLDEEVAREMRAERYYSIYILIYNKLKQRLLD